ncbi:MAG: DUF2231 domain-containing protein [Chloroflexales bacterium]
MYAIHPLTVHFPLALLLASGLFSALYMRRGERAWETSAYHCLIVGWAVGAIALASGTIDALRQLVGPDVPRDNALIGWVNAHAFLNVAVVVIYGQALLLRRRRPDILDDAAARPGYLGRHALGALLLVAGGWVGGHLVYTLGLGR